MSEHVECVVVGAGAVGLAVARELALKGREVIVLERNSTVGSETSSRNNEVIHAGFLYPADSLRGRLCQPGAHAMVEYCVEKGVAVSKCGKLVLGFDAADLNALENLLKRAPECGVDDLSLLTPAQVRELEPSIDCYAALLSPSTAVFDSHAFLLALHGDAENAGAIFATNTNVTSAKCKKGIAQVSVQDADGDTMQMSCSYLINAAGLGATALAQSITGFPANRIPKIHLAKGHFINLSGKIPFARVIVPLEVAGGASFTPDYQGQGKFGPDLHWVDEIDYSFDASVMPRIANSIRRYWPDLDESRLGPSFAGIRPRSWGPRCAVIGDWMIQGPVQHGVPGLINLYGIETPGLTASLSIARYVVAGLQAP
ncbi:MAG: FAD-dependent oxidoreductase [Woeseia sp.]|jgi:L-2-hydroxyglutarate oxidase LhgO|nr:FAD-dependent oxidoreductase [Woeseia sp.]